MSWRGSCLRSLMEQRSTWLMRFWPVSPRFVCVRPSFFVPALTAPPPGTRRPVRLPMPLFLRSPKGARSTSDRRVIVGLSWGTFEFALAKFTCDSPLVLVERFTATGTPCTRLDSLSLLQYHYKCKANCNTLEKTRCLAIG